MVDFSLVGNYKGYSLSFEEVAQSCFTGLTAIPYAKRHFAQTKVNDWYDPHALGHRAIGIIQCIPVIGAVAALIEVVVVRCFTELWEKQNFHHDGKNYIRNYMISHRPKFQVQAVFKRHMRQPKVKIPTALTAGNAAITIQKNWKAYKARKLFKSHFLPRDAIERVRGYLQDPEVRASCASDGVTPVFFPEPLPEFVLKLSKDASYKRLSKMAACRTLCKKEKFSHLEIPKVALYIECKKDELLIEQRMPVNVHPLHQIALYHEHASEFTPAVREFCRFVLLTGADDLVCGVSFSEFKEIRSDNFPLFINEKGEHKIALIDLEQVRLKDGPYFNLLPLLIYLFPYHFDEIIAVAQNLGCSEQVLAERQNDLESKREKGKTYIKVRCFDLIQYLEQKDKTRTSIKILAAEYSQIAEKICREQGYNANARSLLKKAFEQIIAAFNEVVEDNQPQGLRADDGKIAAINLFRLQQLLPKKTLLTDDKQLPGDFDLHLFMSKLKEHKLIYSYFVNNFRCSVGIMY